MLHKKYSRIMKSFYLYMLEFDTYFDDLPSSLNFIKCKISDGCRKKENWIIKEKPSRVMTTCLFMCEVDYNIHFYKTT